MATILQTDGARAEPAVALQQLARSRSRLPQRRFAILGLIMVAALAYLIVSSFSSAVDSVFSPSQLLARGAAIHGQTVRLQGKVTGAVHTNASTLARTFTVSDGHASLTVLYGGDLPDGFKGGAQVEAQGTYNGHMFSATSLTAKCPTKYQAASSSGN